MKKETIIKNNKQTHYHLNAIYTALRNLVPENPEIYMLTEQQYYETAINLAKMIYPKEPDIIKLINNAKALNEEAHKQLKAYINAD